MAHTSTARTFTADPAALYLGDNGICLCGAHLGMTAMCSGRDISGQRLYRLRPIDAAEGAKMSPQFQGFKCEHRTCTVQLAVQR